MAARVTSALLALAAAALLVFALATHSWWSGHPTINGQSRHLQEVHIGLLGGELCNTGGDGTCKAMPLASTFTSTGMLAVIALGVLITAVLVMALLTLIHSDKRRLLAKVGFAAFGASAIVVVALILIGPSLSIAQQATFPFGTGVYWFGLGGTLAVVAGVLARRTPAPLRLRSAPFTVTAYVAPAPQAAIASFAPDPVHATLAPPPPPPSRPAPAPPPPPPPLAAPPAMPRPVGVPPAPPPISRPLAIPAAPPSPPSHPFAAPGSALPALPALRAKTLPPPVRGKAASIAPLIGAAPRPATALPAPIPGVRNPPRMPTPTGAPPPRIPSPTGLPPLGPRAATPTRPPLRGAVPLPARTAPISVPPPPAIPQPPLRLESEPPARDSARDSFDAAATAEQAGTEHTDLTAAQLAVGDHTTPSLDLEPSPFSDEGTEAEVPVPSVTDALPGSLESSVIEPPRRSSVTTTDVVPTLAHAAPSATMSTASPELEPPSDAQSESVGPSPACPQCEAPMAWVEAHLRFFCRHCKMYF